MRHKKSGRKLNRSAPHRRALARNLVASFFEQFGEDREYILTTVAKAKEFRSFAEKLITLGKKAHQARQEAATVAGMSVEEVEKAWKANRRQLRQKKLAAKAAKAGKTHEIKEEEGDNRALAERLTRLGQDELTKVDALLARALHLRRLAADRLRNEKMTRKLFNKIAPAYSERKGGYTRVFKTSVRRLGDGTFKAMLAFTPHEGSEAA